MLFVKFPVIADTGVVCDTPFIKPAPVGASHLYKVPEGTSPSCISFGETENGVPEQTDVLIELIAATGCMLTVMVNVFPLQPR